MLRRNAQARKIGILYNVANAARDRRDWLSARATFRHILDLNPADSAAWVQYGHALKETGATHEAEVSYLQAATLVPNDADIQLQLGHLYKVMNRRQASIAAYRSAHALDPIATDPILELGRYGVALKAPPSVAPRLLESLLEHNEADLECVYRVFLGREFELQGEQDRKVGASLDVSVRELIQSPEFMATVHQPMMAGKPVQGPLFNSPPTVELRHWVASRLPLSPENCLQVVKALSWYELHSAVFADPVFGRDILSSASPAAQLRAAPIPKAMTRLEDIEFLYQVFLGQELELQGAQDPRVGASLDVSVRELIQSLEFMVTVHAPMMAGKPAQGPLFNSPPTVELRHWVASRLPLSAETCLQVVKALSWYELHSAVFADPVFGRDILSPASPAAQLRAAPVQLSVAPAPKAVTRLEDIEFLYQVFLGREGELQGEQDPRVGASLDDSVREFIQSPEFMVTVHAPMMAGKPVQGPLFNSPPTVELRHWVASRLPLSPENCLHVVKALSWYELHSAVFADPVFGRDILSPASPAAQLRAAPAPKAVTRLEDIEFLYQVFLGREGEFQGEQDPRVGASLDDSVREFIQSPEFMVTVHAPMMAGKPAQGPLFNSPPTVELRHWVASRLPLSPETCLQVVRSLSWYELHSAVFADPVFGRDILSPASPAAQLRAAPMPFDIQEGLIETSLLFERDWYLNSYPNVAASGGDPLQHYLMHGVAEGHNPNRLFDTRWYLSAYPHVRLENANPLAHYVMKGARLGYDPHPFFSTKDFLREHPQAARSDLTPLAYVLHHLVPQDTGPSFGPYDVQKATDENYRRLERPELLRHIETMSFKPAFILLIDGHDAAATRATRESISQQVYRHFSVATSVEEIAQAAEVSEPGSSYFLWLNAGDELEAEALYELAAALNADPTLRLIYFDDEVVTEHGPREPFHKPDWSPDYLESFNYIGSAACFELSRAGKWLAEANSRYDFILKFTESGPNPRHIDRVLMCRAANPKRLSIEQETSDIRALTGRLDRTGRAGTIEANIPWAGSYNIKIELKTTPLVSVIIPTAARVIHYEGRRIDLIVDCLQSVLAKSSYTNVEFIIVDNGDLDRDRLKHIETDRFKFVTYSLPEVNIAKKINLGASLASGQVFLILNDDIEPLTSDWIERLLAHLEKPHVGVVGAKLLYPNETIQHAGIVACAGHPEHVTRGKPRDDVGYAFSTCGVRNYLAVTGAVSMTRADTFWKVGGYAEELPIDFNDVDFCYKLIEAGYTVVYEPGAELIHYESASMVKPFRPWDAEHFARKWAAIADDPFYNQYCFSMRPTSFDYAYSPRRY